MENNEISYVESIENIFESELFRKLSNLDEPEHVDNTLEEYEESMKNGKFLEVTPGFSDNQGNLFIPITNDILGVINNEDVFGKPYDYRKRSTFVGRKFIVLIKKIDKENKRVYFSPYEAKQKAREIVKANLKPGMVVKAKVLFVSKVNKRVYIDIEGYNILGYVPIKQWTHGYIYNPESRIKKGMVINVKILRYKPDRGNKLREIYICSRKETLPDPWKGIEQKFPKNSIIEVVATDLQKDKWFAPIPGLDLDIYCEYPRKNNQLTEEELRGEYGKMDIEEGNPPMIIKLGHTYKVRVYNVSEEKKLLKARPIEEVKK